MTKSRNLVLFSVLMIFTVWAACELRIHAFASPMKGGIGPDVIVGDLPNVNRWGSSGGESSYSLATTSCNLGDQPLAWIDDNAMHPVISQNLYRVSNGRIQQLGQSWLKHGFFALQLNTCGGCNANPNGSALGVGCSDPYGAGLNGQQNPFNDGTGGLGPRSEVNASTGVFAFPPRRLTGAQQGLFGGRIRVANADLVTPNASYFIASQYVHPEDAQAGNNANNASFRPVNVTGSGSNLNLQTTSSTRREEPAINAWKEINADVELFDVVIPGDGLVVVGVRTTPSGSGFHTEVAVENLTSHRCVRALEIENCGGTLTNPGFSDVDYHAEDYSGTDWTPSVAGNTMEWATETFAQNQNANALRWGTLYSFWCDTESLPTAITLKLFRPGATSEVTVDLDTPPVVLGDVNLDTVVNLLDVGPFVEIISTGVYQCEADTNEDGAVNLLDVDSFITILSGE